MQLFRFGSVPVILLAVAGLSWAEFDAEKVVARVNGEKVVLAELLQRVKSLSVENRTEEVTNQALERIISNRLVMQEAKTRGIPEVTEAEFRKAFPASAMTLPNLSDRAMQEDWVVGVLRERLVLKLTPEVRVKEAELKARFEDLKEGFQPEMADIRWIVVEGEGQAQKIMARLKAGEDFASLAKETSIEKVSANAGGMVGTVRPDKIPEELSKEIFASSSKSRLLLPPIKVEKNIPFYGPPGYYIVEILKLTRQGETTLEKWRPVVEAMIRKEKATKLLDQTLAKRRRQAKIWIQKDLTAFLVSTESERER